MYLVEDWVLCMEVVFLITGEAICNFSATVNFLQTDPPNIRSKTLLPVESLLQNPETLTI